MYQSFHDLTFKRISIVSSTLIIYLMRDIRIATQINNFRIFILFSLSIYLSALVKIAFSLMTKICWCSSYSSDCTIDLKIDSNNVDNFQMQSLEVQNYIIRLQENINIIKMMMNPFYALNYFYKNPVEVTWSLIFRKIISRIHLICSNLPRNII